LKLSRTAKLVCAVATLAEASTPAAMAAAKPRNGKSLEGCSRVIIVLTFLSSNWPMLISSFAVGIRVTVKRGD
jgi:hypothetical protein